MNGTTEIFLGVIAVASLVMAIVQVGIIVAAGLLARRIGRLADTVEHELKPLFANVNAIGRDASRVVALATAQVERADRLFADLVVRIEQVGTTLQDNLAAPVREGRAILAALRAAFAAIRGARGRGGQGRTDDDDALFI